MDNPAYLKTTTIADYFINEIDDWNHSIDFYLEELEELDEWLLEIRHSDLVAPLDGTLEHHMSQLFFTRQVLLAKRREINEWEHRLYVDRLPLSNQSITPAMKERQKQLRDGMKDAELEILETKYSCDDFIADMVSKRTPSRPTIRTSR
ncbi:MAG TPA: hypothetical protein VFZ78_09050 [Flavisolibacter sp.]